MAYRIVWLREVFADLEGISAYLEAEAPSEAPRILAGIAEALRALAFMPEKHQRYLTLPSLGLRQIPVEGYLALYRVRRERQLVEVVLVAHQKMDIPSLAAGRGPGTEAE